MKTFTIAELASLTGVPPASIHYYLKHELLPAPKRLSPNRFLYDERHVHGLKLIRTLRHRRKLPLSLLRRIMPELLYLEGEQTFRPEIWDRALAPARRQHPSQRILSAAALAFAQRGYDDVNVDQICEAAGVAKGSFYRHYRSKEALFFAAVHAAVDEVVADLDRAAEVRGPFRAEEAGAILGRAIRPSASLVLELLARSLQGRPGHASVAAEIYETASNRVGRWIKGSGTAGERGARVVGAALGSVLREAATAAGGGAEPASAAGGSPPPGT